MKINRQTRFFFKFNYLVVVVVVVFYTLGLQLLHCFCCCFFLYNFHALKEKNIAKIRDATRGYKMGNGFKRCEISINKS